MKNSMKKITMNGNAILTFEEGCKKYLNDCQQRNLRDGTIRHYKQSYTQFFKYFNPQMDVADINERVYGRFVCHLKETLHNDVSINAYLRDFITTIHFLQKQGYVEQFPMRSIKVDKKPIETYSEEELSKLLAKPDLRHCSFTEYQCWVMTNFLFSTGVRQHSLNNIKIKDVDFENRVVHINVTKNRKPLIVPINITMTQILEEYIKHRCAKSKDEYLFCSVFGDKLCKSTGYHKLYWYNKGRGVETTGIHRYRHTFAKQWILSGGDVVTLSKILGHSSLEITQNYINVLVSDVAKKVDEMNILDKFAQKHKMQLR